MAVSTKSWASASGSAAEIVSNCSGVMMVRGAVGTVGIFTPRHGWI
jgi:hypothetical protein